MIDQLTALQDAIETANHAREPYERDEVQFIDIHATDLAIGGGLGKVDWIPGGLQRNIVRIANAHAGCDALDCVTCEAIREGLATAVEALHYIQDEVLERRYNDTLPSD
jgi:hypothetical protein